MWCDSCINQESCEYSCELVGYCDDYEDEERYEWRRDWFDASEDEFGEYSKDDFEW